MLVSKKMRWLGLPVIFAASLCSAGSRCPDPRGRQASIGGDTIRGGVILHKKAVKFAPSPDIFFVRQNRMGRGNRSKWEFHVK